ncbi:helix-turn-helix domain-containing protein [Clostridium rectalis]|uniref:helix-turn-helix domain-containing protein n=1 Tax=Clostridium rectalis TaxID=2040295 RepID=UPI000F62DE8D|nr:helix-turn-helix transcriptional regulator [Clostridium rectalis]
MNLEQAISIVLKTQRKSLQLSQEELAHRCNLDRTYISLLERGKRKPTLNVIFQISRNLNLKPSEFITEVEDLVIKSN